VKELSLRHVELQRHPDENTTALLLSCCYDKSQAKNKKFTAVVLNDIRLSNAP
jgi:hypothetical protein